MTDIAIRVENLSKLYTIGRAQQRHDTLRDSIADFRLKIANSLRPRHLQSSISNLQSPEDLWALRDVSFEVQRGEVVGVIGRNGAGKSTLLKILSRITEPTVGRAEIHGRVGSLLEVGTGFHPELTGRENIYLNGAILGMHRVEINSKFDEIVAFAEIERFLDTPVKRYSSGMYVRLAFAVAAHLEPEILLVDEVLAVGDAEFQKKCLGKMGDVARGGRTVLFVSHNMAAIQALCGSVIHVVNGSIESYGPSYQGIQRYLGFLKQRPHMDAISQQKDRTGSGRARITDFYVTDKDGVRQSVLHAGGDYRFVMEYVNPRGSGLDECVGSIGFADGMGQYVMLVRSSFGAQNFSLDKASGQVICEIDDFSLANGIYGIALFLAYGETEVLDFLPHSTDVEVDGGDFFGTGDQGLAMQCRTLTRSNWRAS